MSNEKIIKSRQQQKHDISTNWEKAVNFIPLNGEIIIYDDLNKIKIGDGETYVVDLEFTNGSVGQVYDKNGGEIFSDYENNEAISQYSTAFGNNTKAGLKGYYWFNLDVENKTFTLSTTQSKETQPESIPYTVNDIISMSDESSAFTNCSTIIAIEGNKITVDALPDIVDIRGELPEDDEHIYICDFAVWCLNKPSEGIVDIGIGSIAKGVNSSAYGTAASATGYLTNATGLFSHAEGLRTLASGERAHAEGSDTIASAVCTHAEGYSTIASAESAHAEGGTTQALGMFSHTEGYGTIAEGKWGHAEGNQSKATGEATHAEGYKTEASGKYAHAEGNGAQATANESHAEGHQTQATNTRAHAEGCLTVASGTSSHAENYKTQATARYSHAEGDSAIASGDTSHAEGYFTEAKGKHQHVQGRYNEVDTKNTYAHIVGNGTTSKDENDETIINRSNAHTLDWDGNAWFAGNITIGADKKEVATTSYVDGKVPSKLVGKFAINGSGEIFNNYSKNTAEGICAHAEGSNTTASGAYAHAEGDNTTASGSGSHAEGSGSQAIASGSHAEGYRTQATNTRAHSEGCLTVASGSSSHAEGYYTKATANYQHIQGKYNYLDSKGSAGNYAHVVGNGTAEDQRSNAHTLDWEGNAWFAGNITVGKNKEELATKEYVDYNFNKNVCIPIEYKDGKIIPNGVDYLNRITDALDMGYTVYLEMVKDYQTYQYHFIQKAHHEGIEFGYIFQRIDGVVSETIGLWEINDPTYEVIQLIDQNTAIGRRTEEGGEIFNTYEDIEDESGFFIANEAGLRAHAEGAMTHATGMHSHAEGEDTFATQRNSHAEGYLTTASGYESHAEGESTHAAGKTSHAEGFRTTADGDSSHAEGCTTSAEGTYSHAEGESSAASGIDSHAQGFTTTASGFAAHSEGMNTSAVGQAAHAEGNTTEARGEYSHAEGCHAQALGEASHAEGWNTSATETYSHAEGWEAKAKGAASHAEGFNTTTEGIGSHAEGNMSNATGYSAHAEGEETSASGYASHSEGYFTNTIGDYSHAEGYHTDACSESQHVQGKWNIKDTEEKYAHIVGNGRSNGTRSNAHTLDWEGNAWFAGNVTVGVDNKQLATEDYVNNKPTILSGTSIPDDSLGKDGDIYIMYVE